MAIKIQENIYKIEAYQLITDKQMVAYVSKNAQETMQYQLEYKYAKAYVPQAYAYLKTLPEFASAEDC
jgi:hypothetical protein